MVFSKGLLSKPPSRDKLCYILPLADKLILCLYTDAPFKQRACKGPSIRDMFLRTHSGLDPVEKQIPVTFNPTGEGQALMLSFSIIYILESIFVIKAFMDQ